MMIEQDKLSSSSSDITTGYRTARRQLKLVCNAWALDS